MKEKRRGEKILANYQEKKNGVVRGVGGGHGLLADGKERSGTVVFFSETVVSTLCVFGVEDL